MVLLNQRVKVKGLATSKKLSKLKISTKNLKPFAYRVSLSDEDCCLPLFKLPAFEGEIIINPKDVHENNDAFKQMMDECDNDDYHDCKSEENTGYSTEGGHYFCHTCGYSWEECYD